MRLRFEGLVGSVPGKGISAIDDRRPVARAGEDFEQDFGVLGQLAHFLRDLKLCGERFNLLPGLVEFEGLLGKELFEIRPLLLHFCEGAADSRLRFLRFVAAT